jgi:hypothetical protein
LLLHKANTQSPNNTKTKQQTNKADTELITCEPGKQQREQTNQLQLGRKAKEGAKRTTQPINQPTEPGLFLSLMSSLSQRPAMSSWALGQGLLSLLSVL